MSSGGSPLISSRSTSPSFQRAKTASGTAAPVRNVATTKARLFARELMDQAGGTIIQKMGVIDQDYEPTTFAAAGEGQGVLPEESQLPVGPQLRLTVSR